MSEPGANWTVMAWAGWLLADLTFIMLIISFSTDRGPEVAAAPTASPSSSSTVCPSCPRTPPTVSASPTPTAAAAKNEGLRVQHEVLTLQLRERSGAEFKRVAREGLAEIKRRGRIERVGLIFVFSVSPPGYDEANAARLFSKPVIKEMEALFPGRAPRMQPFLQLSNREYPPGTVTLWVYFFND